MKVIELAKKCGIATTEFHCYEGAKLVNKGKSSVIATHPDGELAQRTVNTFRVKDHYLEVYLKY